MAISPKMLAVLRKVEAAREAHFADLRETAQRETIAREKLKKAANAKKKPPIKKPSLRAR